MNERNEDQGEERELPSVDSPRNPYGMANKLLVVFGGLAVIFALIYVNKNLLFAKEQTPQKRVSTIVSGLPPIKALPEPKQVPVPPEPEKKVIKVTPAVVNTYVPPKPPVKPKVTHIKKKEITPDERKRQADMFSYGGKQTPSSEQRTPEEAHVFAAADDGKASLADTRLNGARASVITDPSFFLTKGTFFDCALETAIDSTLKGMTRCRITHDIYSTDGNVVLVDRGSTIVGEYRTALKRGQNRLFVVWDRIETPNSVIIDIASPGTDALGRSGHNGFVNTHFWERFGAAIMFSVIADVGNVAVAAANDGNGNNSVTLGNTVGAAKNTLPILVEDGLKIPPTVNINQGDHINIFLAQDLDFRGVYELTATN